MKLSTKEKEIICAAQLQALAPVARIRESTGFRDHTIRYALQKGLESGLLRRSCFLNLFLLGLSQYEVYFSLSAEKAQLRSQVLQALIDCDKISWVGEFSGDYHYGFNICVRTVREVADFLDYLASSLKLNFLEKAVASRLSLSYFGNKYLSPHKNDGRVLSYQATNRCVELDDTDRLILSTLMTVDCSSRREIARASGLPYSTLEYRLKKLEQTGVIQGYYYQVKPEDLGIQAFLLLVSVKGFSQAIKKKFHNFCRTHPAIVVFIEALGSWDYELAVEVESQRQMLLLTQELQDTFGTTLQTVKVLPSFEYPKVREYPFQSGKPL